MTRGTRASRRDDELRSEKGGQVVMTALMRSLRRVLRMMVLLCSGLTAFTTPVSAQTVGLTPVGSISGPADLVEVHGGYAYVAAGPTLSVVDVTNPSAPRLAGAFTFPERIWDFAVSGSLVFVADYDRFELRILDVSNPATPALRSSFKLPGQPRAVAASGTKALVANIMSGLEVVEVSNPAEPVSLGSYFLEGYSRDVVVTGSLAYVVDQPTGFYIVDVSKPGPPTVLSAQQSGEAPLIVAVSESTAQGPMIACLLGMGGLLHVYDVSNPSAPAKVTTFKTPGRAQDVTMQGSLAYVADGPAGLQIVGLSNPAKPTIVGSYKTTSPARDVAVAGSLVFVALGGTDAPNPGVVILRQSP